MTGTSQHVLLVGGSSEIGLAVLRDLVADGGRHAVTLAGRPSTRLASAAQELRDQGHRVHVLTYHAHWDESATRELLTRAQGQVGGLDVVVVAVGAVDDPADGDSPAAVPNLHQLLTVNLLGPALVANAAVDLMAAQGHGTLIVLSSVAAVRTRLPILGYSCAKRALDELVRGLTTRAAPFGVTCLLVRPGRVRTRMSARSAPVPLTIEPETVARHVRRALESGRKVAWSPPLLRPLTGVLRLVPGQLLPRRLR